MEKRLNQYRLIPGLMSNFIVIKSGVFEVNVITRFRRQARWNTPPHIYRLSNQQREPGK